MTAIIGVDAAWTEGNPSGVALLDLTRDSKCVAVAPSYASFIALGNGGIIDWSTPSKGMKPDIASILRVARELLGREVEIIALDMPVSCEKITARRAADDAISRAFGSRWCSAHTPNSQRPGLIGEEFTNQCRALGYPVATTQTPAGTRHRLIEVYPHPALLALLNREKRVPYKVSRARRYWPDLTPALRRAEIVKELRAIRGGLVNELGELPMPLVDFSGDPRASALKTLEDALDAIVSAWVGALYLRGEAEPLGDAAAAIWCPTRAIHASSDR